MSLLFDLPPPPAVPLLGEDARFPVHRVFCVGRNYEAHAREMGDTSVRETPIWFTKAPSAVCLAGGVIPYPPGTANCHYEMELVVAIGAPGFRVSADEAPALVLGYACGLDLTRRDLQNAAKAKGYPWDTGKDFENGAVIGPITRVSAFGAVDAQKIALRQNGAVKQEAQLSDMIWNVGELIADLSTLYHLIPGDLIYTGTPAGVGPFVTGDVLEGEIEELAAIKVEIGAS
ncbi:fumarylacetoacetate hydrolase family protein [Novosphingobium sp. 9U]|uniref:fumarylacetoacetate hydrolase family protein n=1 Tax=Novosphingobium sp. 9U TaxID=2653158 RepID=UPI0012F0DC62|nr:fumarylacetoacetate hydrolase family protein [Novosphingobium sp. 9U]VWX46664.1 Fumarylpyruvate hydrolase [Novosphingobium sp. 9U]